MSHAPTPPRAFSPRTRYRHVAAPSAHGWLVVIGSLGLIVARVLPWPHAPAVVVQPVVTPPRMTQRCTWYPVTGMPVSGGDHPTRTDVLPETKSTLVTAADSAPIAPGAVMNVVVGPGAEIPSEFAARTR
jgi:hypothetical protein